MSTATIETTAVETITVESLLEQIEQLPRNEQLRLVQLIEQRQPEPDKPPLAKPLPIPLPDDKRERQWISEHKYEYAGQWVALDGDRLIAASPDHQVVSDAVKADDACLPLVLRMSSRESIELWEQLKRMEKPPNCRKATKPMPDDKRERQWVKEHKHEYPGQWVALDGDRLIAASFDQMDVLKAARADGAYLPLIIRVPSPDDLPFMGI